jgi:hypothetical protein
MALVGAAVTFRLANFYQGALAAALKEELVSVSKEIELHLEPLNRMCVFCTWVI